MISLRTIEQPMVNLSLRLTVVLWARILAPAINYIYTFIYIKQPYPSSQFSGKFSTFWISSYSKFRGSGTKAPELPRNLGVSPKHHKSSPKLEARVRLFYIPQLSHVFLFDKPFTTLFDYKDYRFILCVQLVIME